MFERTKAKSELLKGAKEAFADAQVADRTFQEKARESFLFRDNEQWDKLEKDILAEERRPALTLNVTKAHIDLVMGLNEDIKKRYVCRPVGKEDAFLCEVVNNVIYWLYQKNDWKTEEDNAFESALISGRGWVAVDFDVDEKGLSDIKITETSIPVHEVRFDPAARKRDLSDASYIVWDRWLSLEDFCVKFPDKTKYAEQAFKLGTWPKSDMDIFGADEPGHDINDESDYSDALDINYFDTRKKQIRVAHMEYWKYAKKWFYWNRKERTWDAVRGTIEDFKKQWPLSYPGEELVLESTIDKELWWLQFCGEDILVHAKSPINYPGFSIVPCFLFGDVSRRRADHFGIVEMMKDPQREINKRTSQTLNLFNQQVQPGVYAEAQAFMNTDQAEQSMKEAGSITWLKDGALSQNRFQERTVPTFPNAILQMGEYAREMLRHITGINPDLLGMNDKRKEAGIVVQLRQQQGMAILKPVFKAYSELRKQLFERQVRIIMSHMPSKQIKKILGEGERYQVKAGVIMDTVTQLQCNFRDVDNIQYDIDADAETDSMSANALEVATYMEMMQQGMAVDPKVIVSKTNLPISEKIGWLDYIDAQQKGASEASENEINMEKQKLQWQHDREMAKIASEKEIAMAKLGQVTEKDNLKASLDVEKLSIQKERDATTAKLKLMQIATQAALGDKNSQTELLKVMLNADFQKKKLILDTMEVMAQAGFAGDELKLKTVIDMYKIAASSEEADKKNKTELLKKAIDMMGSAQETDAKVKGDIAREIVKGKLAERAAKAMPKPAPGGGTDGSKGKAKND